MNKAINIVALCALSLMMSSLAFGQKRSTKGAASKQSASTSSIVCKGQALSKGVVVVGYKSSAKCGDNPELVIKKPSDTEIVCDSSPIPDGYYVISKQGSTACMTADANPLTNALSIARDGLTQMRTGSMVSAATVHRSQPPRRTNSTSDQSSSNDTESHSKSPHLSREEIEIAVRRATVIIGMERQDVSRAWGKPRTNDKLIGEDGLTQIWGYKMGNVYFRNGIVYMIELLKGH